MDEKFMKKALSLAKKSADEGEVPVGCVIVRDGKIVSTGRNGTEKKKSAVAHAEIIAIERACKKLGGWRLPGCEMYVTLEPCPMCYGAIINSRIEKLYFGATVEKRGAIGGIVDLSSYPFNHRPEITGGIMEEESKKVLRDFFGNLRKIKK